MSFIDIFNSKTAWLSIKPLITSAEMHYGQISKKALAKYKMLVDEFVK